eukprot:1456075-Amphidinium_carterae.1
MCPPTHAYEAGSAPARTFATPDRTPVSQVDGMLQKMFYEMKATQRCLSGAVWIPSSGNIGCSNEWRTCEALRQSWQVCTWYGSLQYDTTCRSAGCAFGRFKATFSPTWQCQKG